jgi:hypothetical protein
MKMKTYEITMTIERDGKEFDIEVEGNCDPGTPEYIPPYNKPENYDPGSARECEIINIFLKGGKKWDGALSKEEEEMAIDRLFEKMDNDDSDFDPPEPDYDDYDDRAADDYFGRDY